jgi:hypothetical protein
MTPLDDRSPDARAFDEALAARVRETFDAHEDPATDAGWARLGAALGGTAGAVAADRPAARRARPLVRRGVVLAAVAALAAALGWFAATRSFDRDATLTSAEIASVPEAGPAGPAQALSESTDDGTTARDETAGLASANTPGPMPDARMAVADASRRQGGSAPSLRSAPPTPTRPSVTDAPAVVAQAPVISPTPPEPDSARVPAPEAPPREADAPGRPILVVEREPTDPPAAHEVESVAGPPRLRLLAVAEAGPVTIGAGVPEGSAVAVGVGAEWAAGRSVRVGIGPRLAYTRAADAATAAELAEVLEEGLVIATGGEASVSTREELSTLALEVPLEVAFDVARAPGGRLTVGAGAVSAVYLAQTFRDTGVRLRNEGTGVVSTRFETQQSVSAWQRVDLARQIGLSVGYARDGRLPVSVDLFARIPLRGATSRDVPLGQVGVRLGVGLGR